MLNIEKVRALSKERGISMNFLCSKIGVNNHYFLDVAKKKIPVPNERIIAIADLLGTTTEYLRDESDDPSPQQKKPAAISDELWEAMQNNPRAVALLELLLKMSPEQMDSVEKVIGSEENRR